MNKNKTGQKTKGEEVSVNQKKRKPSLAKEEASKCGGARKGAGRKKLPIGNRRDKQIVCLVTVRERQALRRLAKETGRSQSRLILEALEAYFPGQI